MYKISKKLVFDIVNIKDMILRFGNDLVKKVSCNKIQERNIYKKIKMHEKYIY